MNEDQVKQLVAAMVKPEALRPHECRESKSCTCSVQALEPNETCPVHGSGQFPPRCGVCGKFLKQPEPAAPVKDAGTRVADEAVEESVDGEPHRIYVESYGFDRHRAIDLIPLIRANIRARVNAAIAEAVAADREQRKAEASPAQPQPEPAKGRTPGAVEAERIVSEAISSDNDQIYIVDWGVRTLPREARNTTIKVLRIRLATLIDRHRAESAKAMRERCVKRFEKTGMTWAAAEIRNLPLEDQ